MTRMAESSAHQAGATNRTPGSKQRNRRGDRIAAPSSIPQGLLIALRPRWADHRPLCCDAVNRRPGVLRFGDYEFRPDTGDLRRVSPLPPGTAVRLAPQPAKLLELLLERRGELLERDEIRRALWSDTHVDFDQSLAFCVRQLRAALGDSGAKPAYIETLPRRGFRLVAPVVEPTVEPAAESAVVVEQENAARPASIRFGRAGWSIALLLLVAAAAIGAHLVRRAPRDATRLAIMPFELAASVEAPERRSRLALVSESLMVDLGARPRGRHRGDRPQDHREVPRLPLSRSRRAGERLGDRLRTQRSLPRVAYRGVAAGADRRADPARGSSAPMGRTVRRRAIAARDRGDGSRRRSASDRTISLTRARPDRRDDPTKGGLS